MELNMVIEEECGKRSPGPDTESFDALSTWCLLACQGLCNVTFIGVIYASKDLQRWVKKRLDSTLGEREQTTQGRGPSKHARTRSSVNDAREMYKLGLETATKQMPKAQTAPKELKDWQLVQLMAWSGQTSIQDVEPVWEKLAETTDPTRARTIITKAIERVAKDQHVNLPLIFLSDQIVKDIMKLRLLPTLVADYYLLMEGIAILEFMEKTPEEVTRMKRNTENRDATTNTRTLTEAKRNRAKAPKEPPTNMPHMKEVLTTYAMFLRALFTDDC